MGVGLDALIVTDDEEDPSVVGMPLELGRVEGLRVGGGVRLGAKFGGWVGGMMRGRDEMTRSELAPIVEGNISAERTLARGFVLRIAGERKFSPLWDARIAVDNRATTTLSAERGALKARLQLGAGVTELRAIAERTYVRTGGVTVEAQYTLSKYLDVRARSEVGRSLYAPGVMDKPQWASETMLMLAAHTP